MAADKLEKRIQPKLASKSLNMSLNYHTFVEFLHAKMFPFFKGLVMICEKNMHDFSYRKSHKISKNMNKH